MTDPEEMLSWLNKRIASVELWLECHGREAKKPRPEGEITVKEDDRDKFHEMRGAYQKAVDRRNGAAA